MVKRSSSWTLIGVLGLAAAAATWMVAISTLSTFSPQDALQAGMAEGGQSTGHKAQAAGAWPGSTVPSQRATEAQPGAGRHSPADFAQHMMRLRPKVPKGFTVVIQPPFVVIGDEPPQTVRMRAERTVKWAVDKLKAAYFKDDPRQIIDIWLFKDKASYEKHCRELFGTEPSTPYGFFSHAHRALIMNIATGGGTLVHEIVHPFMEANFPACPAWFNEGLGSLYEQSAERDGQIVGRTNWRLAGLQEAISKNLLPPFRELCTTTTHEFYFKDKGTNYAQARYLCYYLQEVGLLQKYYHAFHAAQQRDPSGYETLKTILGRDEKGMDEFQEQWQAWVLRLRFP